MGRHIVCLIDHTVLLGSTAWQQMPWNTLSRRKHLRNDVLIVIPDFIKLHLQHYLKQEGIDQYTPLIEHALSLIPHYNTVETFRIDRNLNVSVTMLKSAQTIQDVPFEQKMLKTLSLLKSYRRMQKVLLWTQDEELCTLAIAEGYQAVLIDRELREPQQSFHIHDFRRQEYQRRTPKAPMLVKIEPLGAQVLQLNHTEVLSHEHLQKLLDSVMKIYPIESMFRIPRPSHTPGRVFYAMSKKTIDHILHHSNAAVLSMLNLIYRNWTHDMAQWIREMSRRVQKELQYRKCIIILEYISSMPVSDMFFTITVDRGFAIIPETQGISQDIPPPRLPVITRQMCAQIEKISSEDFLRVWGIEPISGSFVSPSFRAQQGDPNEDRSSFLLIQSTPQMLKYRCRSLQQGYIAEIPFRVSYHGEEPVRTTAIHYRYEGSTCDSITDMTVLEVTCSTVSMDSLLTERISRQLHLCI